MRLEWDLWSVTLPKSPRFLTGYKISARYIQTLLVAREESSHHFLFCFIDFPKDIIKDSVLDGPSRDATHVSVLVQSSQEKALSMDRHSCTTHPHTLRGHVTQTHEFWGSGIISFDSFFCISSICFLLMFLLLSL